MPYERNPSSLPAVPDSSAPTSFCSGWRSESAPVVNLDCLTYAGNPANLASVSDNPRYTLRARRHQRPRSGAPSLRRASARGHRSLCRRKPRGPLHPRARKNLSAPTSTAPFRCSTKPRRTGKLCRRATSSAFAFCTCPPTRCTDRWAKTIPPFSETTAYAPNSPYAASKAASDHLVRAYFHTYGLPTLTTNCSNNYGPFQFPEKLIPLMILNALNGKPLPVYGDGQNVRDWLFVGDHCAAIRRVLRDGRPGETYNIGGRSEQPQSRSGANHLRRARRASSRLAVQAARGSHPLRDRPPRPRSPLCHRLVAESSANSDWQPQETFEDGHPHDGRVVSRSTSPGCRTSPAEAIATGSTLNTRQARGRRRV